MKITAMLNCEQRESLEQLLQDVKPLLKNTDPLSKLLVQSFTFEISSVFIETEVTT